MSLPHEPFSQSNASMTKLRMLYLQMPRAECKDVIRSIHVHSNMAFMKNSQNWAWTRTANQGKLTPCFVSAGPGPAHFGVLNSLHRCRRRWQVPAPVLQICIRQPLVSSYQGEDPAPSYVAHSPPQGLKALIILAAAPANHLQSCCIACPGPAEFHTFSEDLLELSFFLVYPMSRGNACRIRASSQACLHLNTCIGPAHSELEGPARTWRASAYALE